MAVEQTLADKLAALINEAQRNNFATSFDASVARGALGAFVADHADTIFATPRSTETGAGDVETLSDALFAAWEEMGSPSEWPGSDQLAERLDPRLARPTDATAAMEAIPADVAEQVLAMGRAEWGATAEQTSEAHLADFANTLRLTREHFNFEDVPVKLHGLYLEGTGTVLCHTGTSPNSGANAQALTGAWNWLHDQATAALAQLPSNLKTR